MTDPGPDDDLQVVSRALEEADPGRVEAVLSGVQTGIRAIAGAASVAGITAAALGWWAWGSDPLGLLAVLVGLAALALPWFVARRAVVLADAVAHPADVVRQARDLVSRTTGSPQLHDLATTVRGRRRRAATRFGRARRFLRVGRLVSAVIGVASPDPDRHRLLVPFSPERLRSLWLAAVASLWLWPAAALLAFVAALALAARALS